MLIHTFTHIPGIGEKQEQKLWSGGITDWQAYLDCPKPPLSPSKHAEAVPMLQQSIALFDTKLA